METSTTAQAGTGIVAPNLNTNEAETQNVDAETQTQNPLETAPTEETQAPDKQAPRTFSQEELNRLIKRETDKALKTERERIEKERTDADLTETQKAQQKAEESEKRVAELEGKLKRFTVLEAAQKAARDAKITFTEGALDDAFSLGLLNGVIDEEGKATNAAAAVKELAKARPTWVQSAPRNAPDLDSQRRGNSSSIVTDDEEKETLKRFGFK